MNASDLTLNIAVNLGRISRWAMEGKKDRIKQFIKDTSFYINKLDETPKSEKFNKTFKVFKERFDKLKNNIQLNEVWAEDMLTWASILTHRSKLANQ